MFPRLFYILYLLLIAKLGDSAAQKLRTIQISVKNHGRLNDSKYWNVGSRKL